MMKKYDILFLAGLFPHDTFEDIEKNTKKYLQNAANTLQNLFAEGLEKNAPGQVRILNSPYVGSFPMLYRKPTIKSYAFKQMNGTGGYNVGFLNVKYIQQISRYRRLKPHIKKWAMEDSPNPKILVAYASTITFTRLLRYANSLNRNVLTCLIVPDLPQYMNVTKKSSFAYNFAKSKEIYLMEKDYRTIDSFVLLTDFMKGPLNINVPYTVIEGIATTIHPEAEQPDVIDPIKILYTGTLSSKYGILELVEAFKQIQNQKSRLLICGAGETESYIQTESEKDDRIIFMGELSREKILNLQKNATLLVNPRANNEEFTKYSFPSKIMEYLSSGTPTLAYKLDGIPDEYYDYMYTISTESDGLKNSLDEVLSYTKEELQEKGNQAQRFVKNQKNAFEQVKKMIKMFDGMIDHES